MASEKIDALELDITSKTSTENIEKLITSLGKLSQALNNLKSKKVSVDIQQTGTASASAAANADKLANSFFSLGIRITAVISAAKKLGSVISDGVANSATYIKTLNMFNISLGQYADNASKYGETVRDALGIDPSGWQKTQAVFATMLKGIGIVGDEAAYMSQNLTQLAYDVSSYNGITVEEAANKLKSGLAGRTQPVRTLGYAVDQTEVVDHLKNPKNYGKQTYAIDEETGAIKANSQALADNTAKILGNYNQLKTSTKYKGRYNLMIEQSSHIQGSYARALNDPYNQMKLFNEQLNMTSRQLGNMFIPALNKVLPYLSAFAQIAEEAFKSLAQLFGFELPDMKDRTSIDTKPYDHVVKATGKAKDNAKKMKDYMLGIDELNVFNPNMGAGAGGSGNKGKNGDLDNLMLKGYDFLGKAVENAVKKAKATIKKFFKDLKDNPFLLNDIFVWGAGKLGASIWEKILGVTPEELAKQAREHGNSVGYEFWAQFNKRLKAGVGNLGAGIWELILGKSPEKLAQEAAANGTTVGKEFMKSYTNAFLNQNVIDMIFGSPEDLARRAGKVGRDVTEQFRLEVLKGMLKLFDNPIMGKLYNWATGRDIGLDLQNLEKQINGQPIKKGRGGGGSPYKYVSADDAKKLSAVQNGTAGKVNVDTLIPRASGAYDEAVTIERATKNGKKYVDTYAKELESGAEKVKKAANNGLYKPAYQGADNNGSGASKFKYVSFQDAKEFYSNFSSKETKDKTYKAAATMAQAGANGADSKTSAFTNAGIDNTAGYIKGIRALLKEVGEAGADIGAKAIAAAKKKTRTESPSKAFAEIGMFNDLGYAKGITENAGVVTKAVSVMADKALTTMRKASDMSNSLITSGSYSMPATNAGYGIGAANTDAMASLAGSIYQAVVSGISSVGTGSGDINVIIDGKEVFKAVQTESRKRGVAISNGAFSR